MNSFLRSSSPSNRRWFHCLRCAWSFIILILSWSTVSSSALTISVHSFLEKAWHLSSSPTCSWTLHPRIMMLCACWSIQVDHERTGTRSDWRSVAMMWRSLVSQRYFAFVDLAAWHCSLSSEYRWRSVWHILSSTCSSSTALILHLYVIQLYRSSDCVGATWSHFTRWPLSCRWYLMLVYSLVVRTMTRPSWMASLVRWMVRHILSSSILLITWS